MARRRKIDYVVASFTDDLGEEDGGWRRAAQNRVEKAMEKAMDPLTDICRDFVGILEITDTRKEGFENIIQTDIYSIGNPETRGLVTVTHEVNVSAWSSDRSTKVKYVRGHPHKRLITALTKLYGHEPYIKSQEVQGTS